MATDIEAIRGVTGADPGSGNALLAPEHRAGASPLTPRARPPEAPKVSPAGEVGLVFELNAENRELIIKIVDRETRQIIRQIPPEDVQRMRATMQAILGVVLDQTG